MNNSSRFILHKWETDFFGRDIFHLQGFGGIQRTESFPVGLLTAKVDASDQSQIRALLSRGFSFVESDVNFELDVGFKEFPSDVGDISRAKPADLQNLIALFAGLYSNSRFRSPWFNREENSRLYTRWIEAAVEGSFDDDCIIEKRSGEILGFVTIRKLERTIKIGLLGVNPDYRGKGVGGNLLKYVIEYSKSVGIDKLHVATQGSNTGAIKLYASNDFKLENLSYWLYKHEKNSF